MNNPWKVQIHGQAGEKSFEISVVNVAKAGRHQTDGYGWFDQNKLLISHNGGPCNWPLIPLVWEKMVKLAEQVAFEMNERHGRPLFDGMTRADICKAIANAQGEKYGFTDKDFAWSDAYERADEQTNAELVQWCKQEYGG